MSRRELKLEPCYNCLSEGEKALIILEKPQGFFVRCAVCGRQGPDHPSKFSCVELWNKGRAMSEKRKAVIENKEEKMEKPEIEVGQLWEVVASDFHTSPKNDLKRKIKIEPGEWIEIRYPYAWHFRTERGEYYHAQERDILEKCKMAGVIWEAVRFENIASLEDIKRLKLYKEAGK